MSSLHAVQIALEGKAGTTTAGARLSTAEEKKQDQGEVAAYSAGADPQRMAG